MIYYTYMISRCFYFFWTLDMIWNSIWIFPGLLASFGQWIGATIPQTCSCGFLETSARSIRKVPGPSRSKVCRTFKGKPDMEKSSSFKYQVTQVRVFSVSCCYFISGSWTANNTFLYLEPENWYFQGRRCSGGNHSLFPSEGHCGWNLRQNGKTNIFQLRPRKIGCAKMCLQQSNIHQKTPTLGLEVTPLHIERQKASSLVFQVTGWKLHSNMRRKFGHCVDYDLPSICGAKTWKSCCLAQRDCKDPMRRERRKGVP